MCHALSMLILYLEVSSKKNPNNFCAFDSMLFMCAQCIPGHVGRDGDSKVFCCIY